MLIYVRKHGPKLTLLKLIQDMENAPEKSEVKAAHLSTQRWMGARGNTKARTFQEQNAKFVITNISMILQAVVSSFELCPQTVPRFGKTKNNLYWKLRVRVQALPLKVCSSDTPNQSL